VVSVVALVAGGVLSSVGYQASSATVTVTGTSSFLTATTVTSGSVTTASVTTQTTSQTTLFNPNYNIRSPAGQYGCMYSDAYTTLDAGPVGVSFSTTGNDQVDFWILNPQQLASWPGQCQADRAYTTVTASRIGVNHWETTVNIPSSGTYYFRFMNSNDHSVSVSLSVTKPYVTQTTAMLISTSYSTQSSTWPTQTLAVSRQPAGLGVIFFLGVALLIAGVVVFGLSYTRPRRGSLESGGRDTRMYEDTAVAQVTIPVSPPGTTESDTRTAVKKAGVTYCMQCGAEIPKDGMFCEQCGTRIDRLQQ
jgi:ribosomal protein L40E